MKVVSGQKLRDIDAMAEQLARFNQVGADLIAKISASEASLKDALARIDALKVRVCAMQSARNSNS